MCFKEGCSHGIDGPGSVAMAITVGTRGSIGVSKAVVTLNFCSPECVSLFFLECPTQQAILEKVRALCENKKTNNG